MGAQASSPAPKEARHVPLPPSAWQRLCLVQRYLELCGGARREGVYRVPGSAAAVARGAEFIKDGVEVQLTDLSSNDWASAVKSVLRAYAPITGYDMFDALMAAVSVGEDALLAVCAALPTTAQLRLDATARHVVRVSRASSENRMPISNLAKFWGSLLARPNEEPATDIAAELAQGNRQYLFARMLLAWYDAVLPAGDVLPPFGAPFVVPSNMDELAVLQRLWSRAAMDAVRDVRDAPVLQPLFASHGVTMFEESTRDGSASFRVRDVHEAVREWRRSRRPSQEHVWGRIFGEDFAAAVERSRRERLGTAAPPVRPTRGAGGASGFARNMLRHISVFAGGTPDTPALPSPASAAAATTVAPNVTMGVGTRRAVSDNVVDAAPAPRSFIRRASALLTGAAFRRGGAVAGEAAAVPAVAPSTGAAATEDEELAAWERAFGGDDDTDEGAAAHVASHTMSASRPGGEPVAAAAAVLAARAHVHRPSNIPPSPAAALTELRSPWGFSSRPADTVSPALAPLTAPAQPPSPARHFTLTEVDSSMLDSDEEESHVTRFRYTGPRRYTNADAATADDATGRRGQSDASDQLSTNRRVSVDLGPMLSPGTRSVVIRRGGPPPAPASVAATLPSPPPAPPRVPLPPPAPPAQHAVLTS